MYVSVCLCVCLCLCVSVQPHVIVDPALSLLICPCWSFHSTSKAYTLTDALSHFLSHFTTRREYADVRAGRCRGRGGAIKS